MNYNKIKWITNSSRFSNGLYFKIFFESLSKYFIILSYKYFILYYFFYCLFLSNTL
jgi:hypothetical protein